MMKYFLFLLFCGALGLAGADIVVYKPTVQLIGKRSVNRPRSAPGSGVVRVEKVTESGYRFVIAIQNKSGNMAKLATGFNHVRFDADPRNNCFVLHLSHRILSAKPVSAEKAFPVIQPMESFHIVTLRPGEGTLLNVTCWVPEGKIRDGDKLVVEYAPCNFGRYDFLQLRVRSAPAEFKMPAKAKKADPVLI